jgi:hypothetical protein
MGVYITAAAPRDDSKRAFNAAMLVALEALASEPAPCRSCSPASRASLREVRSSFSVKLPP